jgi:hypothetical protein
MVPVFMAPGSVHGQDEADNWSVEVELGGSIFFGNRPQTQFTTKTEVESTQNLFESGTAFEFTYGVSEDEFGRSTVNRRSWVARSSLDFRPDDIWRPFVSGRMESSFERRIDRRYDAGVGVKYDRQTNRDNRVEFSLQLLAERTYPRGGAISAEDGSLARWSSNLRVRRTFVADRLALDLRSDYRPVFDAFGNFTYTSQNAFTVTLTEVVALRLNFKYQYDSGAVDRGARTNRDGQVQLSIVARF